MKKHGLFTSLKTIFSVLFLMLMINCSSDESGNNKGGTTSVITVTGSFVSFGEVDVLSVSQSQSIEVKGGWFGIWVEHSDFG